MDKSYSEHICTVYISDSEPDKSGSLPELSRTNPTQDRIFSFDLMDSKVTKTVFKKLIVKRQRLLRHVQCFFIRRFLPGLQEKLSDICFFLKVVFSCISVEVIVLFFQLCYCTRRKCLSSALQC